MNTEDESDIGYIIQVDMEYPDAMKEKTKHFPICPESKVNRQDKIGDYMNETKSKTYIPRTKLIFDWTDMRKNLNHKRMLKFYTKHGMVVEKVHERISFTQSRWLKRDIEFNTLKRALGKIDFEKDLPKGMNCRFYGKTLEIFGNRKNETHQKNGDIR